MGIRTGSGLNFKVAILLGLSVCPPALSEDRTSPSKGEFVTASVGGTFWEHYKFDGMQGVIIDAPVKATWGSAEQVDLAAGTGLFILRERKLKACREQITYSNLPGAPSIWTNCLVDSEDDGKFDKVIYSSDGFAKRIEPPVPYKKGLIEIAGTGSSNFRKVILYSGVGENVIKFSYREFTNDMARPAYTEELAVPLGKSFPQDIAVKDSVFTLIGLDGMGVSYKRIR